MAICTELAARLARVRAKQVIDIYSDWRVKISNSGRVPGASMVLINDEKRVLHTGDFTTRKRFEIESAKPIHADILIIEAPYGTPGFIFPKTEDVVHQIRDWVEETLADGFSVIFLHIRSAMRKNSYRSFGLIRPMCMNQLEL